MTEAEYLLAYPRVERYSTPKWVCVEVPASGRRCDGKGGCRRRLRLSDFGFTYKSKEGAKGKRRRICKECWRTTTAHNDTKRRETRRLNRLTVLGHYGGQCKCCGEAEPRFLVLDHLYGNGNQHRLAFCGSKKGGSIMWARIIKAGFPPIFQVLCNNCNTAKVYGECPHIRTWPPARGATSETAYPVPGDSDQT